MANITSDSASTKAFAELIAKDVDTLPKVTIGKDNPNLFSVFNGLAEQLSFKTSTDVVSNTDAVNQACTAYIALKNNNEYDSYFEPLNKMATGISENIQSIFNILNNAVKPEVDSLSESIEKAVTEVAQRRNMGVVVGTPEYIHTDFRIIPWDSAFTTYGGPEGLVSAVSSVFNLSPRGNAERNLRMILADVNQGITEIAYDQEIINDMIARVCDQCDRVDDPIVADVFQLITRNNAVRMLIDRTIGQALYSTDRSRAIMQSIDAVVHQGAILELFDKTDFNMSQRNTEELHDNITKLRNIFMGIAYGVLYMRNELSEKLLIGGDLLNPDQFKAMEDAGLTQEDIAKYIHIRYTVTNTSIPDYGITVSEISRSKDTTDRAFAELLRKRDADAASLRNMLTRSVAREVLLEYLKQTATSRIPEGVSLDAFVRDKQRYIDGSLLKLDPIDDNLITVLYDFILTVHYRNTLVGTAHELLGAETMRQLEARGDGGSLDQNDVFAINITVAARLMAKFLADKIFTVI